MLASPREEVVVQIFFLLALLSAWGLLWESYSLIRYTWCPRKLGDDSQMSCYLLLFAFLLGKSVNVLDKRQSRVFFCLYLGFRDLAMDVSMCFHTTSKSFCWIGERLLVLWKRILHLKLGLVLHGCVADRCSRMVMCFGINNNEVGSWVGQCGG